MKSLLLVGVVTIYVLLGIVLQDYEVIIKPAYWSMYGFTFGTLGMAAVADWE